MKTYLHAFSAFKPRFSPFHETSAIPSLSEPLNLPYLSDDLAIVRL